MATCASVTAYAVNANVKVMSFNVWHSDVGTAAELAKLGNAIVAGGTDIVGVQELDATKLASLVSQLSTATGKTWYSYSTSTVDEQILSSYPVLQAAPAVSQPNANLPSVWGVQFEITPGHNAWIFNGHLASNPYQPYLLRDGTLAQNEAAVIASANSARIADVQSLLSGINGSGAVATGEPIFITGDFNEPSHLDWTPATANATARTFDLKVAWPASNTIVQAGYQDSFRVINPDPVAKPGYTWTPGVPSANSNVTPPTVAANEVHDRIDFVYYRGSQVTPTASKTYSYPDGNVSTDVGVTGYNSDHRAVVSQFSIDGLTGSTLTFSKLGTNGAFVNQSYGDRVVTSPNTLISYAGVGGGEWKFWEQGNWNKGGVAFLDSGSGGQANGSATYDLILTPDAGFGVKLTGFDLIDFAAVGETAGHTVNWSLKNGSGGVLSSGVAVVADDGSYHVDTLMTDAQFGSLTLSLQHTSGTDNLLALDNIALSQTLVPGDYNVDGKVDSADYVLWRRNPSTIGGDPGGYAAWRSNFGNATGSGNSLGGNVGSVPEPATIFFALVGGASAYVIAKTRFVRAFKYVRANRVSHC